MAAFFLVFLYVTFELSYDSFHSKADRIYRVVSDVQIKAAPDPGKKFKKRIKIEMQHFSGTRVF
jgi:hypothetical protein